MQSRYPFLCAALLYVLTQLPDVYGQQGRSYAIERAYQRFFQNWSDARSVSTARSVDSIRKDASSVLTNPAGLAFMSHYELSSTYAYNQIGAKQGLSEYQHIGIVQAAIPLGKDPRLGTIGFGTTTLQGGPNDEPINSEHRPIDFHIAYGRRVSENVGLGLTMGYFRNEIYSNLYDYQMRDGVALKLGIQAEAGGLSHGGWFSIGHGTYQGDTVSGDAFDSVVRQLSLSYGASIELPLVTLSTLIVYSDLDENGSELSFDERIQFGGDGSGRQVRTSFGAEIAPLESITVRTGVGYSMQSYFFNRDELESLRGDLDSMVWSFGFGVDIPLFDTVPVKIDLATEDRTYGTGNRQVVGTLSVSL